MENLVYFDKEIESPYRKKYQKLYNEIFIGGYKKLSKECFFKNVIFPENKNVKDYEKMCKEKNNGGVFFTRHSFTGVVTMTVWSEENSCFLTWKHTPKKDPNPEWEKLKIIYS